MRSLLTTCMVLLSVSVAGADIQASRSAPKTSARSSVPLVSAPTRRDMVTPPQRLATAPAPGKAKPVVVPRSQHNRQSLGVYPWRYNITATVFWVGEDACASNPVHNHKSSWDGDWRNNFGGFDDPNPDNRMKGPHDYRPKNFTPQQNPFYIALPYNDVSRGRHKAEAARVIPWFRRDFEGEGKTVCKGKWVQITYNGKHCFAQWEDCGPFNTEDWKYVFGDSTPQNTSNKGAGIDISPSVRDYLGIKGGTATVSWRFVDFHRIPRGPWSKYGANNPFIHPRLNPLVKAEERRIEQLRARQHDAQRKAIASN